MLVELIELLLGNENKERYNDPLYMHAVNKTIDRKNKHITYEDDELLDLLDDLDFDEDD